MTNSSMPSLDEPHPSFLAQSQYIDWHEGHVRYQAEVLARDCSTAMEVAGNCFYFVRDKIKHSWDYKLNPVTCKASDVLKCKTGFCYAKSHLLAALLRANNIPAALCYQRLCITSSKPPYCLHGLNAVWLEPFGWYRIDARGNKDGDERVFADFSPPQEQLAFSSNLKGELDLEQRYSEPLPEVIAALEKYSDIFALAENLPDTLP